MIHDAKRGSALGTAASARDCDSSSTAIDGCLLALAENCNVQLHETVLQHPRCSGALVMERTQPVNSASHRLPEFHSHDVFASRALVGCNVSREIRAKI